MGYYRVYVEVGSDEEHYVKAKNKKEAENKVRKECYGEIYQCDVEKCDKEEYEDNQ